MNTDILHRLKKTREQSHNLICIARTLRAETLCLQGHLFELHWRFLDRKLHYRYVLQGSFRTKNSGSSFRSME